MLPIAIQSTRRLLLARAIQKTATPNPINAARVDVSIKVPVNNGIAITKRMAAPDRLFGTEISIPTASAAMS